MNTQHAKSYPMLAITALVAALTLTACGPQDGVATGNGISAVSPPPGKQAYQLVPVPQPQPQPHTVAVQTPVQYNYTKPAPVQAREPVRVASATLGEVQSIDPIRTRPQGNGTGAVLGGVLGAVLGNQVGHGGGKAAATALGAVGGAVAGNNVERNYKEGVSGYRVRVQFDNGTSRTYEESRVGDLKVGDRVRVDGGQVRRV